MVGSNKQNPIPLAPLIQLQETREKIGRFRERLKVEMGGFKYSEALEVEFHKQIEGPKPHKYENTVILL